MALFNLGEVDANPGELFPTLGDGGPDSARIVEEEIKGLVERHASGDWGEISAEDQAQNNRALQIGGALRSVYTTTKCGYEFTVTTEADRGRTTVLRSRYPIRRSRGT